MHDYLGLYRCTGVVVRHDFMGLHVGLGSPSIIIAMSHQSHYHVDGACCPSLSLLSQQHEIQTELT